MADGASSLSSKKLLMAFFNAIKFYGESNLVRRVKLKHSYEVDEFFAEQMKALTSDKCYCSFLGFRGALEGSLFTLIPLSSLKTIAMEQLDMEAYQFETYEVESTLRDMSGEISNTLSGLMRNSLMREMAHIKLLPPQFVDDYEWLEMRAKQSSRAWIESFQMEDLSFYIGFLLIH